MNKELYGKYGNYFLNYFKDDSRLKISKKWINDEILHIDICTNLPSFEFFMGIFPYMVVFDGICVCDHGIEFENIERANPQEIYSLLDSEAKLILKFIKEGLFLFAYKDKENIFASSLTQLNRKNFLKNLNIKKLYNSYAKHHIFTFEEVDSIKLLDFYGDVIYEYTSQNNQGNE